MTFFGDNRSVTILT